MRCRCAVRIVFYQREPMAHKNDNLLIQLDELDHRYSEIEEQISQPEICSNVAKLVSLSKEQAKLRDIVEKYRRYKVAEAGIEDASEILQDETVDEDFKALAKEELKELEEQKAALIEEIKNTLVMADDTSVDSVIIEIRAGTGGEEAALFARNLHEMYLRYAESRKWKVEQLEFNAVVFAKWYLASRVPACGRNSAMKGADIAFSACRRRNHRVESTPLRRQ